MGFKTGRVTHTHKNAIHSFKNDPDLMHQTCVTCGCKKITTYSNKEGKNTLTYYDKYGNKLDCIPSECNSLYSLL